MARRIADAAHPIGAQIEGAWPRRTLAVIDATAAVAHLAIADWRRFALDKQVRGGVRGRRITRHTRAVDAQRLLCTAVAVVAALNAHALGAPRGAVTEWRRGAGLLGLAAGAHPPRTLRVIDESAGVRAVELTALVTRLATGRDVDAEATFRAAQSLDSGTRARQTDEAGVLATGLELAADDVIGASRTARTADAGAVDAGAGADGIACTAVASRATTDVGVDASLVTAELVFAAIIVVGTAALTIDAPLATFASPTFVAAFAPSHAGVDDASIAPLETRSVASTAIVGSVEWPTLTAAAVGTIVTCGAASAAVERIGLDVEVLVDLPVAIVVGLVAPLVGRNHRPVACAQLAVDALLLTLATLTGARGADGARVTGLLRVFVDGAVAVVVAPVAGLLGRSDAAFARSPFALGTQFFAELAVTQLAATGPHQLFVDRAVTIVVFGVAEFVGRHDRAFARTPFAVGATYADTGLAATFGDAADLLGAGERATGIGPRIGVGVGPCIRRRIESRVGRRIGQDIGPCVGRRVEPCVSTSVGSRVWRRRHVG